MYREVMIDLYSEFPLSKITRDQAQVALYRKFYELDVFRSRVWFCPPRT